ncbi:MAG: YiiD C-terminal domain-containing protein [Pseudobdellovibrionaceae bacterium]
MNETELEKLLKMDIPISKEIGIHDLQIQNNKLTLKVPLAPNFNHKKTMFGGSLYSAAALACYGLFLSGLRDQDVQTNDIVISEGNMRYIAPVRGDAVIESQWESEDEMIRFFQSLKSKKKARVLMRAQVLVEDQVCAEFSGHFVAHKD